MKILEGAGGSRWVLVSPGGLHVVMLWFIEGIDLAKLSLGVHRADMIDDDVHHEHHTTMLQLLRSAA